MCHCILHTKAYFECIFHLITAHILNVSVLTASQKSGKALIIQAVEYGTDFFLVQSEEVWRRAPSPVQHQSMASPLAHPAQFSTTSRVVLHSQALLFSLIHILSVLNTIHAAHFSGGKNSPKKCIVLDSPPKRLHWLMCAKCHCLGEWETGSQTHSSFPTPSTWHYGESYTPAKLQAAHLILMDF